MLSSIVVVVDFICVKLLQFCTIFFVWLTCYNGFNHGLPWCVKYMARGPPVTTKPGGEGFCGDRRTSCHVFHTSRQAMIKTYNMASLEVSLFTIPVRNAAPEITSIWAFKWNRKKAILQLIVFTISPLFWCWYWQENGIIQVVQSVVPKLRICRKDSVIASHSLKFSTIYLFRYDRNNSIHFIPGVTSVTQKTP